MKGIDGVAAGLLLGAAALAGCGGGDSSAETAALRARLEAQAAEIDALRKAAQEQDARFRLMEERLAAEGPARAAAAAGKPGAAPAAVPGAPADGKAAAPASPATEAVAAYLETEAGKEKIREAMQAEEKRRAAVAEQEQKERQATFLKEWVTGTLTAQLGLDTAQQEAVIAVAGDAAEKMAEVWRGWRDARQDPNFLANARTKSQEIRQQAMDKLSKTLSTDQYNKLQDVLNEPGRGGILLGGGGRGFGGMGGGGPAGGGQGGPARGGN